MILDKYFLDLSILCPTKLLQILQQSSDCVYL